MFLTRGDNDKVIINDNHPKIFQSLKACMQFQFHTQTNVSIDGKPCSK